MVTVRADCLVAVIIAVLAGRLWKRFQRMASLPERYQRVVTEAI
jgi:hypothetical protein